MEFDARYAHDRQVWDTCAHAYEAAVVHGHPDVTAYEAFEEDLLDRLLGFLIRDAGQTVHLFDVGCGSGRLHLRYGLNGCDPAGRPPDDPACQLQALQPGFRYAPEWAAGVPRIGGVDFSREMLALARRKLEHAGLGDALDHRLYFELGSAFDLAPFDASPLPVAVTLCNSIGVMQGPAGAQRLFQAMRRAVESAGGIAMISMYRGEAIADFALGNYESTMDASGQPRWLTPDTYAEPPFEQRPLTIKRAYDKNDEIRVAVTNGQGRGVQREHVLRRDPSRVAETVATGHIQTHHGYESRWYATAQVAAWIREWWSVENAWHFSGNALDALRAAPAQLAIYDPAHRLRPFFERMGIRDRTVTA